MPKPCSVSPAQLLEDKAVQLATRRWEAALCVCGHGLDAELLKVLDVLADSGVPTVVLAEAPEDQLARLNTDSCIASGLSTEPIVIASYLRALTQRQAAVRAVEKSLEITQSFQGEAAAEIDRLHDELLLAAKVQRDFLPKQLPEVAGLEPCVIFRPAGFVSGDIYDIAQLDEHRVAFFLADAMGHGVPAALMTLFISANVPFGMAAAKHERFVSPAHVLNHLNRELNESGAGPTRFASG